jgi:hypothetical protein
MVSMIVSSIHGAVIPLTAEQLQVVNTFRSLKGREPLLSSPGKQFFEYGIRRDGWWNYEKFSDQTVAICDVVEALWPHEQLVFEVDHSSGHT